MILWIVSAPAHDGRDSNLAAVMAMREAQEAISGESDPPSRFHEGLKMVRDGQVFALAQFDDLDTDTLVEVGAKLNEAGMLYTCADEQPEVVLRENDLPEDEGWEESAQVAIVVMSACGGIPAAAVRFLTMLAHAMPSAAEDLEDAIALIRSSIPPDA